MTDRRRHAWFGTYSVERVEVEYGERSTELTDSIWLY